MSPKIVSVDEAAFGKAKAEPKATPTPDEATTTDWRSIPPMSARDLYRETYGNPEWVIAHRKQMGQAYRQNVPDAIAAGLGKIPFVGHALASASRYVVPQDLTQAGIAAVAAAAPPVEAFRALPVVSRLAESGLPGRLLTGALGSRTAAGAVGGGAGAYLEGKPVSEGITQGTVTGLLGAGAGQIAGRVGQRLGSEDIMRLTTQNFGKVMNMTLHHLGLGNLESGKALDIAFRKGGPNSYAERMALRILQDVRKRARAALGPGGRVWNVPVWKDGHVRVEGNMTFDRASAALEDLQQRAYNVAKGTEKSSVGAPQIRKMVHDARQRIAAQLNELHPGLGDEYRNSGTYYGAMKDLTRIFRTKDMFTSKGHINTVKMVDKLARENRGTLDRDLGEATTNALLLALRRGDPGPVMDALGPLIRGGGMSVSPYGLHPFFHLGGGDQFVGTLPGYATPSVWTRLATPALAAPLGHLAPQGPAQ